MKKLILLILLCLPFQASAWVPTAVLSGSSAAVVCYDCASDNASFLWECNSTTVGTGSPCGCSDGDTTTAANDEAAISSGTCTFDDTGGTPDGNDYFLFDVSSDDIFADELGTVFIKFKVDTFDDDTPIFVVYGDADNSYRIKMDDSDEIATSFEGQTNLISAKTADSPLSTGTVYIARGRWRIDAGADPNIDIHLFNTSMVEQGGGAEHDTNLTEWDPVAGAGEFVVGNGLIPTPQVGANFTIYYIHLYTEWIETDPNG